MVKMIRISSLNGIMILAVAIIGTLHIDSRPGIHIQKIGLFLVCCDARDPHLLSPYIQSHTYIYGVVVTKVWMSVTQKSCH